MNDSPSWNVAPPWAQWLAQDGNGVWYWYEKRPRWCKKDDLWFGVGRCAGARHASETLEERPE